MRDRGRRWLAVGGGLAGLLFIPLPRACDPRGEEVPPERYGELLRFADTRTRPEVEAALRLVDPDGLLAPYFTLDDAVLEVRRTANDRASPVRVKLRAAPAPAPPGRRRRIALDPGHFGGAWSMREKRHVHRGSEAPVREGDLAWATARLAERDLGAAGAEVRLLRGPPPGSDYPASADPGFDVTREASFRLAERHPRIWPWLTPVQAVWLWRERTGLVREPFELYLRFDLRRRAAVAEEFAPDVTLSIHYDFTESDSNGILVFLPGNARGEEFATASQRFWAFRRVLDGTQGETRRLANAMGTALMQKLDLPALSAQHDAETGRNWRAVDPERGVYARDLAILRRTPGIVLLLEGPCVNQSSEYQRLQGTEIEIDGRRYPHRVREYADAVLEGLRAR